MKIDMDKIYALMTSTDFKDRLKAEYWQTKDRYEKLSAMIAKYEADRLDFEPLCPLRLLKEQREYMLKLIYILQHRAAIENVELNEDDVTLTEEPTKDLQEGELVAIPAPGGCKLGIVTNRESISVAEAPSENNVEADAPFCEGEIVVIHEDAIYQVGIVRKVQIGGAWVALHNNSKAYFYKFKELHHIANSDAIRMV